MLKKPSVMENSKNSQSKQISSEDQSRSAFEYSFPTNDVEETESNKSTPYFTPLEFFQSSFEFPSPTLDKSVLSDTKHLIDLDCSLTPPAGDDNIGYETPRAVDLQSFENAKKPSTPKTFTAVNPKQMPSTSPAFHRKLRRFSLYERRSCSPQHLLIRNTSGSVEANVSSQAGVVDDKENTKPMQPDQNREENMSALQSGNNSPILLIEDKNSPNIMVANESRLPYSPKLLSSFNTLNLGGSPLGVISSAGYKNGNYFKFPEVDHVVQENSLFAQVEDSTTHRDNHWQSRQNQNVSILLGSTSPALSTMHHKSRHKSINQNEEKKEDSKLLTRTDKKNRKNKNNLTIKISDVNNSHFMPQISSPKPKTPTIKSTKEKALSLDSAAGASELSIVVFNRDQACVSCDEIDSQDLKLASNPLKQCGAAMSHEQLLPEAVVTSNPPSNRSTSLSRLSSLTADVGTLYSSSFGHFNKAKIMAQSPRRKMIKAGSNEWLHYHRKQHAFNQRAESTALNESKGKKETPDIKSSGKTKAILLKSEENFYPKHIQSSSNTPQSSVATPHRSLHKHNPLLHASNTNLKTLPEFLTLVEFTNNATRPREHEYPYKQKSFDLPSSSKATSAHNTLNSRSKAITTNSATNLLQRRGSNHSLTLNLHGSCGNLLGSCRSGLSTSNYSLGSAANSTTNLNSKSSYNLDLTATSNTQTLNVANTNQTLAQDVKQSLFRRRGSNNSLTLQLNATSCGNLNYFCSQNSLCTEGNQLLPSGGVTRTTSFITPTKNTASSTPKRGLLERRGSNQSLTLNMSASIGGVSGTERHSFAAGSTEDITSTKLQHDCSQRPVAKLAKNLLPIACSQPHHRKFFSSENLSKANTQFSDLNHTHKRNSQQVCFGSVSDLQPSCSNNKDQPTAGANTNVNLSREQVDFQDSAVCTCTGVRNITTRPLSPQTTSEEFKIYLANIQMLQNASNALNQFDLIKLNHIFDNSYALASNKLATTLPEQSLSLLSTDPNKGRDSPPGLLATSEDCEVAERYLQSVQTTLSSIKLGDEMQKRIFCDLHKEFWDLPLNHQEKPMVFGSQTKNRYKTILPNENSRVILENEWKCLIKEGKATGMHNKDNPISSLEKSLDQNVVSTEAPYINANYIKGPDFTSKCYIATQGPLPNTIFEFWLMVYQNTKKHLALSQKSSNGQSFCQYHQKIVMLTNFLENHRQKCSVYFPIELNELFLAAEGQETISISKEVEQFFKNYLMPSDNDEDKLRLTNNYCLGILESKCIDLPVHLHKLLPLNSNYFFIKNIGIVRKNGFSIRKLSILFCINTPIHVTDPDSRQLHLRRFCCYHYWYPDWPDHRSPKDINTLLDICLHILNLGKCEQEFEIFRDKEASPQLRANSQHVDQYQQDIFNDAQPLPVIHCSAGIGRTGCLVAILNGVRQLRQSLAFSLISMAAGTSNHQSSPVDFRLPVEFMQEFDKNDVVSYTDTDSSFTRNTLLYVNYILEKQNSLQKEIFEKSTSVACEHHVYGDYRQARSDRSFALSQLPELSDLPKLPDVYVDVLGIVCNLRLQRGGMVQNSEQYELIHRAICLYLKRTFALKRF